MRRELGLLLADWPRGWILAGQDIYSYGKIGNHKDELVNGLENPPKACDILKYGRKHQKRAKAATSGYE